MEPQKLDLKSIEDVKVIEVPTFDDHRGKLCFLENTLSMPFDIKRIYYVFDVPSTGERGGHAHLNTEHVFIGLGGSCSLYLSDGTKEKEFTLNDPTKAVYAPAMMWRTLNCFTENASCLVLASKGYIEEDYIRDFKSFQELRGSTRL